MAKRTTTSPKEPDLRATSLKLPPQLWKATHIRAMEEGIDFRQVVWKALELYLKTNVKK